MLRLNKNCEIELNQTLSNELYAVIFSRTNGFSYDVAWIVCYIIYDLHYLWVHPKIKKLNDSPLVEHWVSPFHFLPLMLQGFCGICYQVCNVPMTVTVPFQLSGTPASTAASETACTTDWIQIPCATDQQSSTALLSTPASTACINKICGSVFTTGTGTTPTPVYSK